MIVGYLDISENNVSRQEQQILLQDYACSTRCRIDVFHCDSDIRNLYQTLQSGRHTVLVANIVSLGSSLRDIRNNRQFIVDNGLSLVSVKEDYTARPNQKTMDILQGFDLALNMRKSMQSIITANSLNRKKAAGITLGRRFGSRNKKRRLDDRREDICQMLTDGISCTQTARQLGVSRATLYDFLHRHPEIAVLRKEENHAQN